MINSWIEAKGIIYANDTYNGIYYDFEKTTLKIVRIIYSKFLMNPPVEEKLPQCSICEDDLYFYDEMIWCKTCNSVSSSLRCPAWVKR